MRLQDGAAAAHNREAPRLHTVVKESGVQRAHRDEVTPRRPHAHEHTGVHTPRGHRPAATGKVRAGAARLALALAARLRSGGVLLCAGVSWYKNDSFFEKYSFIKVTLWFFLKLEITASKPHSLIYKSHLYGVSLKETVTV